MEFLTLAEMRGRTEEVRKELAELLAAKAVVTKPDALQWRFLAACVERMLAPDKKSEFDKTDRVRAAQWKFEAEDKLGRFYLRPGKPVNLVFTLVHKTKLADFGILNKDEFPDLLGYIALVRDLSKGGEGAATNTAELRPYLERVIAEAAEVEFAAYMALPEIHKDLLEKWFCKDSPAYKEIMGLLNRHKEKRWVLTNPFNPSTKRLLTISIKEIGDQKAVAHTTEYWYLRWWSEREKKYTYPYRETNRQVYILHREPDGWKVYQNLRPSPRTSAPHRRAKR